MEIKKFESYEKSFFDDDQIETSIKKIISDYVDNELDGMTLQEIFDDNLSENDLQDRLSIKNSLINYIEKMLSMSKQIIIDKKSQF